MAKKVIIEVEIEGTQEVLKLQQQIKDTKKELKETEDIKAYDKLSGDLVKLQSNLKEARKQQRQAVDAFTATNEGVGAYSRLSAQLRVARNNLKDLQASGQTTGAEVEKLTSEVNQLDTQLKNIDRSVGQTNREVGAYEAAVRKAVGITDAQTGAFTRLDGKAKVLRKAYRDVATASGKNSKQAKQLAKDLAKVEQQLKEVSSQANRASSRIGGLGTQARSLGPAFATIANSFIIFSEIPALFEDLKAGLDFTVEALEAYNVRNNEALRSQLLVNDQIDRASEGFFKERQEVSALFKPLEDDNLSRDKKRDLINKINESYGQYLPNLLSDKTSNEDLAIAQQAVNRGLAEKFALQAQEAKIAEISKKIAEEEIKFIQNVEKNKARITDESLKLAGKTREEREQDITDKVREGTDRRVALLVDEAKAINSSTKAVTDALFSAGVGFDQATKELDESAEQNDEARLARQRAAQAKALQAQQAAGKKRASQAAAQAKKEADQLKRLRDQFLKGELKDNQSRISLINKLEEQAIKAALENQEEGEKRSLDLERNASRLRIENIEAQEQRFIDSAKARQEKVNAAFGEGSQKALELQATLADQRLELSKQTDILIEQERIASAKRLEKISKDANAKEQQEAKKALSERLAELQKEQTDIVNAAEQEQLKIRELRAKGQIDAQEADKQGFEARVKALKKQISQLNQQEFALIGEQGFGAEVAQEEFDKIVSARQRLNTQLAELDAEQTKKAKEEGKKRGDDIREDFEKAAAAFGQSVQLVGQIADLANQKVIERIEKDQEEQEATIMALEERLQTASGLEAKFLEESIAREEKAAEELAQKKIRAEKEALIAKKAVSITEAVINTALAISAALVAGPPLGFILAGLAGALGAVQIATIAAQPVGAKGGIEGESFALGGMVVGKSHAQGGEKFAVGGRVVELEGGEAVINKRSTAMFRNQLSDMNAAGGGRRFQTGGIAGAPMQAPRITREFDSQGNLQAVVEQNSKLLQATNSRIDRIQVEYTTATDEAIQEDKQDRKEIQTTATL